MKVVSIPAEVKALRSICSDYERVSAKILASTDVASFNYPPTREAYAHIRKSMVSTGELPTWTELCSSPELSENIRKILKGIKEPPLTDEKKVLGLTKTLDKYRKLRVMFEMQDAIAAALDGDQVDIDELIESAGDFLSKTRVSSSSKAKLTHFGKGNNSSEVIKNVLYGDRAPFVPTGFSGFDKRNGGILRGSLFMLGGFTGLGKTATAINLLMNMTAAGEDVAFVSLEMTAEQVTARIQGILTGQDVNRISQRDLNDQEKHEAIQAYGKWIAGLKENNTRYSLLEPEEDVDIQDVLLTLKPYKYDVILIDYISLLKGVQGDDQWKKLLEVTRFAKMFAKTNNCIVALLFQTTKEGAISFSKNMANDCNNMWVLTGPTEEMDILPIQVAQVKARNQSRHSFNLLNDTRTMRTYDDDENGPMDSEGDSDDSSAFPDINDAPSDDGDAEYDET